MISIMIDQLSDEYGRGAELFAVTTTEDGHRLANVKLEHGLKTRDEVYDRVVELLYPKGRAA